MLPLIEILNIVCDVCEVTIPQLVSRKKTGATNIARGMYYMVARDCKYHPTLISQSVLRSRPACIIVCSRYQGYLKIRDKLICRLYDEIMTRIKNYQKN